MVEVLQLPLLFTKQALFIYELASKRWENKGGAHKTQEVNSGEFTFTSQVKATRSAE
jgi:hypothetical protein